MLKVSINLRGGSVQNFRELKVPSLESPTRPKRRIPPLEPISRVFRPVHLYPTSKLLPKPRSRDVFEPTSKILEDRNTTAFMRCDIANGYVSEDELRTGVSRRSPGNFAWLLDQTYIAHVREQLGLSQPVATEISISSSQSSSSVDNQLSYQPLPHTDLFKNKSVVMQLCSDKPHIKQAGVEASNVYRHIATKPDVGWAKMLYFDITSANPIAKGKIQISNPYTASTATLYKKSGTYVCFVADGSTVVNQKHKITLPFLFLADYTLGNQIFASIFDGHSSVVGSFETYPAHLIANESLNIPEMFVIKSV